ncbi:hypothetical protein BDV96DRAFT_523564 [Lophiotrema nucula]|uniref:Uncharacterized protein n=1 Tax=Lophiotrema nucula TaxID=690887 RepID=A0A6A5Z2B7_9PLEO|nr:hypothetical protein BDV96DRAFT_523564 [Lophiotrema nucula]
MSPAAISNPPNGPHAAVPSPTIPLIPQQTQPPPLPFDKIFHDIFWKSVEDFKIDPAHHGQMTEQARRALFDKAFALADESYFGNRMLGDSEHKLRALCKLFVKVLAEEPWKDDWIRPHDVERKLSRFEMHPDSIELAAKHGWYTPRDCIAAARQAQIGAEQADPKNPAPYPGPFDDIEVIFIPGTVSSTATNKIDRTTIYPISVSSVANVLHTHICRSMKEPFTMAHKFVHISDTDELLAMQKWAQDACDFAPHLLDNDNISLLLVLLILPRSEVVARFRENGIRIEGSTISHRRAECTKQKLGWKNPEERKPFDNTATDFQTRVKNAVSPPLRGNPRLSRPRAPNRKSSESSSVGATTPNFPNLPRPRLSNGQQGGAAPPVGYFAPPPSAKSPFPPYQYPQVPAQPQQGVSPIQAPPQAPQQPLDPIKAAELERQRVEQMSRTNETLRHMMGGRNILNGPSPVQVAQTSAKEQLGRKRRRSVSGTGSKDDPMNLS